MKKLSILCSSLLLALMMCFPVFASENLRYVEDNANLLTVTEEQQLNDTLTEISERQGVDVGVITADDMGDKSIEDYAKAKYNERGYGDDGVLLVVNMEVREWWMSTYGKGTTAISSEDISTIGSEFAPYLSSKEYADAFEQLVNGRQTYFGNILVTSKILCDDYITRAPNLSEEYAQALSGLTSLQDGLRFVNDDARLLTEDERKELNDTLAEIGKRQGLDVAILTTKDTGGKALLDYAMTMYGALEYGQGKNKDGILLVVNMETRKFWMATHGYGITAFTDAGISYISEKLGPSFKKEKYMKAFTTFGSLCEKFVEKAHNGKPYDVGNMPFKWLPWYCVPISLLVGFVCAVFVVSKKREQLHSVSFEDKAHNYMKKNTLKMKESHDYFLYHTITRNRIKSDDDDSSSGGSSTFTSSSGDTYGGGGGSF